MMRLKAINPYMFFMMPFFCVIILTYIGWGNLQAIIGIWGLSIIYLASYHIGTFEIKAREEDQEDTEK